VYYYWTEWGWGAYLSEYDINVGRVSTGQELYGARPGFEPGTSGGGGKNPYANVDPAASAFTNPVPTLSSPGSSSFGVAIGGHVGFVTNIDAYGVTVTASLGKTSFQTIQNIKTALRSALLKKGYSNEDIKNLTDENKDQALMMIDTPFSEHMLTEKRYDQSVIEGIAFSTFGCTNLDNISEPF
jgi:hypothetical protein